MKKVFSFVLILLFLIESVNISFAEFTIATSISQKDQELYKAQVEVVYKKLYNQVIKNPASIARDMYLKRLNIAINSKLSKKISSKDEYLWSYLKYLIKEGKDISVNKENNGSSANTSVKSYTNFSIEETKKTINEKFKDSGITISYFDNKTDIQDKCFIMGIGWENVDFWTRVNDMKSVVNDFNSGKSQGNTQMKPFLTNRMNFYVYLDSTDLNKSRIYKDFSTDIDYLNFGNNLLTSSYTTSASYDFKKNENGKIILDILKKDSNNNTVCSVSIENNSHKGELNFEDINTFVGLLNSDKGELIHKMVTTGFFINLSQSLIEKNLITRDDILNGINLLRKDYGLSPLKLNESIIQSAQKHSEYLRNNPLPEDADQLLMHSEKSGLTGFSGITFSNRIRNAGYNGDYTSEAISPNVQNTIVALHGLLYVPYHRVLFLSPSISDIGFTFGNNSFGDEVFDFGGANKKESYNSIVFPANNAEIFIYNKTVNEYPQPFRGNGFLGYPITIDVDTKLVIKSSVTLKDMTSNLDIPIMFDNKSTSDELHLLHFVNSKSLEYGKKYQISYKIKGESDSRTSYFYTGKKNIIDDKINY